MFKRILLPVALQGPRANEDTLEVALDFARRDGAELIVMHVLPGFGMPVVASYFPASARETATRETNEKLAEWVEQNIPAGIKVATTIGEGRAYEQILREAKQREIDLIVIRSQRLGKIGSFLLGSTAERVTRHAHCTVIVVRDWKNNRK
ncbi:MAG: universal stress protein [Proteobacteria bacterium]|nr:MAG: universal stress protein [Pseudomonadota bacterium]QKK11807.1 MAG: universal stress protein [Pseudomonadota bacterium]